MEGIRNSKGVGGGGEGSEAQEIPEGRGGGLDIKNNFPRD